MNDPYENLANAIIVQAANDYRKALRDLKQTLLHTDLVLIQAVLSVSLQVFAVS